MSTEALLVGFLSGGGGAIAGAGLTTYLRNRHERDEAWRDRLFSAADEFSVSAMQTLVVLNHLWQALTQLGGDDDAARARYVRTPEFVADYELSGRHTAEVHVRLARIHLLFGEDSPAYAAADETMRSLREVGSAAARGDVERLIGHFASAQEANLEFSRAARAAIRGERRRVGCLGRRAGPVK